MQEDYEVEDREIGIEQAEEILIEPFRKKEVRKIFSRIGFSYALFLVVSTIAQWLIVLLLRAMKVQSLSSDFAVVLSMGSMYIFAYPVFLVLFKRIPVSKKIENRKWSLGALAVCFLISLSFIYIGNIIGQIFMFIVSRITKEPMINDVQALLNDIHPLTIFLLTVLIAPVMEELMFRKVLINRTIQYGQGVSIVVSGVLFGLVHGNFYQFFYACALGMVFAYIYVKTGRIQYTIIFHMLINFMGSIVPIYLLKFMERAGIIGMLAMSTYGMMILGVMVTGIILLICYRRYITFEPGEVSIPKGDRFTTVFLNVGMIVYFIICIVMFLIG